MPRDSFDRLNSPILHPRTLDAVFKLKMYCFIGKGTGNFEVIMNARKYAQKHIKQADNVLSFYVENTYVN